MTIRLGVFLPTFCGPEGRGGDEIAAFASRAEELGFDSVWATDHLLHGSLFYRVPWLDPLVSLSFAAAVTQRVDLGTSILVMPTRHPVILAKELATLQALSDRRYILGAGTGWDEREFEAVGTRRAERGARTDEALEIVQRLLVGERLTHEGRFYQLRGIQVGPATRGSVRVWIAGGRQLPHASSPERPVMAPTVLTRIAAADGWIARPTALASQIRDDLKEIRARLAADGRDPGGFTVAHENFLHLVPTEDRSLAEEEQRRAFTDIMGEGRSFEYFEHVYLTGTLSQVVRKIDQRITAGVQYLMLHTLDPSTRQLDLWAEHLLPLLRDRRST